MENSKNKNDEPYQYMMDTIIRFFMNLNITHIGVMSVCFIEKLAQDMNGTNADDMQYSESDKSKQTSAAEEREKARKQRLIQKEKDEKRSALIKKGSVNYRS